jgi:signal transduction histidine kinase
VGERTVELHFQKTLLESLSQASADGILAIGNDGRVIFANHRFLDMWHLDGQSSDCQFDEFRRAMLEQLQPHQRDPLSSERNELSVEQPEGLEELILTDGRTIERYSSAITDPNGTTFGRVWFFRDTTERKRMQRQILEAGERERQRIGQDLHDDLCQRLAGLACLGQALHQQLLRRSDTVNHDDAQAALEIVEGVQHANQQARDLAKGLQPLNFQRQGLVAALQNLAASIRQVFHVDCEFHGEETHTKLDDSVGLQLYRICQEAISNAVRHGKAKHVLIDLVVAADRLILTIEDDGMGIEVPLPEGGMGLYTMNYRARLVGGSLTIERNHPAGTVVTCSVPLPAPANASQETSVEAKM